MNIGGGINMKLAKRLSIFLIILVLITSCAPAEAALPTDTPTPTNEPVPTETVEPTKEVKPEPTPTPELPDFCALTPVVETFIVERFKPGTEIIQAERAYEFTEGTIFDIWIWGFTGPVFLENSSGVFSQDAMYALVQVSRQVNPIVVANAAPLESPKVVIGVFEGSKLRFDWTYEGDAEYYKLFQVMFPGQIETCNQFPETQLDVSSAALIDGNYYFSLANDQVFDFKVMPGFKETIGESGGGNKSGGAGSGSGNNPQPTAEPPGPGGNDDAPQPTEPSPHED